MGRSIYNKKYGCVCWGQGGMSENQEESKQTNKQKAREKNGMKEKWEDKRYLLGRGP